MDFCPTPCALQSTNRELQLEIFLIASFPPTSLLQMEVGISNHPSCAFPSLWLFDTISNKLKYNFQNLMQPIFSTAEGLITYIFFFHFTIWYKMGIHI